MMRFDFTNKRVLVTGGTRGIANAVVQAFNKAGAQIAINGRTADSVAQAIGRFPDNQRLFAAPGDVGRVAVCENALNSTGVGAMCRWQKAMNLYGTRH